MSDVCAGSLWRHKGGALYRVILIANYRTQDEERYPVTVVYEDIADGSKVWCRPLSKWHDSMTIA